MEATAHFEDIRNVIAEEISSAKERVYVAVAWFTDEFLMDALVSKAKSGVEINLIMLDDDINSTHGVSIDLLEAHSGKVYRMSSDDGKSIMHNKFCVIDNRVAINGSYNWTNRAQLNDESITIIKDDYETCFQFITQFNRIIHKYHGIQIEESPDMNMVIKRLELIKNLIALGEIDEIPRHSKKLEVVGDSEDLKEIIRLVSDEKWTSAVEFIEHFVNRLSQLAKYVDPRVYALKLEIDNVQIQTVALRDELVNTEKTINQFLIVHNKRLGQVILDILRLKKTLAGKYQDRTSRKADKEYENYKQQVENTNDLSITELDANEEAELRKLYKQAALKCHPDRVNDEFKSIAEEIFKELNEANERNDLSRVREIFEDLKKNKFKSKIETINEIDHLDVRLKAILSKRDSLLSELRNLKESETYQTIISISDWNEYFIEMEEKLKAEKNKLEELT